MFETQSTNYENANARQNELKSWAENNVHEIVQCK